MGLLTAVSVGNALTSCIPWCGRRVEDATYIGYEHEDLLKSNAPDVMVAILMKVEPSYEVLSPHKQQIDYTKYQVNHSQGVAVFHVPKQGQYAQYGIFGIETVFAPGSDIILGIRMVWNTDNTDWYSPNVYDPPHFSVNHGTVPPPQSMPPGWKLVDWGYHAPPMPDHTTIPIQSYTYSLSY